MIGLKNKKKEAAKNKKRKKWPFIVLLSIVSVWTLVLGTFVVFDIVENSIQKEERQELLSDFEFCLNDSFCCYYSDESNGFYYKNEFIKQSFSRKIIAFTESRFVVVQKNGNSSSKATKTEILLTDWKLTNDKLLFSLAGDYECCELFDGRFLFTNSYSNSDMFLFDFENGIVIKQNQSFEAKTRSETIGKIVFYEAYRCYSIEILNEPKRFLMVDKIDSAILKLIQKWSFRPSFCQKMLDESICCVFQKNNESFWAGQTALLLLQLYQNADKISYQIVLPESTYQYADRVFDIRLHFSEEAVFK